MANILPLILVGGAAAAFGLIAGKKAKKKNGKVPVPTPEEPTRNVVKTGTSGQFAWRVRIKSMVPDKFYSDILAPGSNQWQPIGLASVGSVDKAKDFALEAIGYAKQIGAAPSGQIVEEGVFHGWGWRIRRVGPMEDMTSEYISEILAPGTEMWTAAYLDKRDNQPDAKLIAQEVIGAARDLAVSGT